MEEFKQTGIDPLTEVEFIKTRSNQKFETRQNQIIYNNIKARRKRSAKVYFDRILDKNRCVMKSLLAKEATAIKSKDFLLGAGFNFSCSTHFMMIADRKWNCVYEYAFKQIENDLIKIIEIPKI